MPSQLIRDAFPWTHGLCSVFAAAFRRHFGGELWAIVNHSRKYPNDDELMHCYCVIGDKAYDALGDHPVWDVSNTSHWDIPEIDANNDCVLIWRQVDESWLEKYHMDFVTTLFPRVYKYLDKHPEVCEGLQRQNA